MSRSWNKGSTHQWRITRANILAKHNHTCQIQTPNKCTTKATQVHHTKGKTITGDNPQHLTAACQPCNNHIGDPTRHTHDPKAQPSTKW